MRPSECYIWTNFDEPVLIQSIGELRGIDLERSIDELDQAGLNKYRYWKGRWPGKIKGLPEDKLILRVTLNALDHQFGTCNRDLTGSQIAVRKNGHWIERQVEVPSSIPVWLPDALP